MVAVDGASRSARPTTSSSERAPIAARWARTSSAMWRNRVITWSTDPVYFARRSSSWVVMPTGQVFSWQVRTILQPRASSGTVPNP